MNTAGSSKLNNSDNKLTALLQKLRDGVYLAYLCHGLDESSIRIQSIHRNIDLQKLGTNQSKSLFEVGENLNAVINAAKKLQRYGIVVVNCGANDILECNTDVVLGLVWQLIRAHLLRDVNLVQRIELIRLMRQGESIKDLLDMKSEQLLLRWVNHHLERASATTINNFSSDVRDGRAYSVLLDMVAPSDVKRNEAMTSGASSPHECVQAVIDFAQQLGCHRFVTAADIESGHQRLNLAFVAGIFNEYIGI